MSTWHGVKDIFPPDLNQRQLNPDFVEAYGVGDWIVYRDAYFQTQNRFAFSPLPSYPASLEGLALLLFIKKFSDTPAGMKSLERIAVKYIDTIGDIMSSIAGASKSNPYTGLHYSVLNAGIAHKTGLISDGGYLKVLEQAKNMIQIMQILAAAHVAMDGITTLVEGSKTTVAPGKYGTAETRTGLGLLANTKAISPSE